jgi:hypothetical protein
MEHDDCCLATDCLGAFVLALRGDMGTWFELIPDIGEDWLIAKHKTFKIRVNKFNQITTPNKFLTPYRWA